MQRDIVVFHERRHAGRFELLYGGSHLGGELVELGDHAAVAVCERRLRLMGVCCQRNRFSVWLEAVL